MRMLEQNLSLPMIDFGKLWNVLPHELRSISNINTFKRHLKTHQFSNAFF